MIYLETILGEWKYSNWAGGRNREQLVNLSRDPGEMVNLATCDRYCQQMAAMRKQLQAWKIATNDWYTVPGYEMMAPEAGWAELEKINHGTRWPWQSKPQA